LSSRQQTIIDQATPASIKFLANECRRTCEIKRCTWYAGIAQQRERLLAVTEA
jgi:hypothetical protein